MIFSSFSLARLRNIYNRVFWLTDPLTTFFEDPTVRLRTSLPSKTLEKCDGEIWWPQGMPSCNNWVFFCFFFFSFFLQVLIPVLSSSGLKDADLPWLWSHVPVREHSRCSIILYDGPHFPRNLIYVYIYYHLFFNEINIFMHYCKAINSWSPEVHKEKCKVQLQDQLIFCRVRCYFVPGSCQISVCICPKFGCVWSMDVNSYLWWNHFSMISENPSKWIKVNRYAAIL